MHGNAPANRGSIYTGPTLVEIAGEAGYRSGGIIGGITLQDQACGLGRGFDHYDDRVPNNPRDFTRPADQVSKNAVSWIKQRPGPYVAFVHYFDAHFPYTPKAEYAAMREAQQKAEARAAVERANAQASKAKRPSVV